MTDAVVETNGARTLVLSGRPHRYYTIESVTNLVSGGNWDVWREIALTEFWHAFPDLEPVGPPVFYQLP